MDQALQVRLGDHLQYKASMLDFFDLIIKFLLRNTIFLRHYREFIFLEHLIHDKSLNLLLLDRFF